MPMTTREAFEKGTETFNSHDIAGRVPGHRTASPQEARFVGRLSGIEPLPPEPQSEKDDPQPRSVG